MYRLFACALVLIATVAFAKPDRKDGDPKKDAPPDLAWLNGKQTNWGVCTVDGRKVTLKGHPNWWAAGELRKTGDGWRVVLIWDRLDGQLAPGVYELGADAEKVSRLIGRWNYSQGCEEDGAGGYKGLTFGDTIWAIPPVID